MTIELSSGMIGMARQDHIGWLIFDNQAKLNAISPEMSEDALKVVEAYEADPDIRVVIMRGAGEKAFISGGDISKFDQNRANAEVARASGTIATRLREGMVNMSKPLIAMIYGYCLGGGVGIALNADLRFAASTSKFGIPAAQRGIAYPAESLQRLIDLMGPSRAKDLMFSARRIDPEEALRLGLINRIFDPAELEKETLAYAKILCENAPLSIKATKLFVNQLALERSQRDTKAMRDAQDAAANSQDFKEATLSFKEKRKPVFTGR